MQEKEKRNEITEPKKRSTARAKITAPASSENEFLLKPEKTEKKKPSSRAKTTTNTPVEKPASRQTAKSSAEKKSAVKKSTSTRKKSTTTRTRTVTKIAEDETLHEALELENEELVRADELIDSLNTEIIDADQPEFTPEEAPVKRRSAFRLRRAQKETPVSEEDVPVLDLIHRRSGLSEEDVTMMFELGYESELARLVGYETMKKLRYEHLRRHSKSARRHYRTAFGYRGEEYVSAKQNEAIRASYAADRRHLLHRIFLTALLSLVIFFLDIPALLGVTVAEFHAAYPFLLPIASIAALGLCASLSWRQLYAGARSLMHFTPTPYSIASVVVPIVAICSLITLIPSVQIPFPVNFSASLLLLALAIGDGFRIMSEIRAFRILSVESEKIVLESATPRKKKLLRGNKIVQVINDDLGENLYRVRRAEQTTGFFRRVNTLEFAALELSILIGSSFAFALLLAFVTALNSPSFGSVLTSFATALLLSTPVSIVFSFFYPLHRANAVLEKRNCALIGDEAAVEYAEDQTVIFNDIDLYTAQNHTRISIRDGDEFRQDIRLAEAVFRRLGNTLKTLGTSGSRTYNDDPSVSFIRITENGLEAVVDNDSHVLIGSADFLRRSGIHVARESTDVEARRTKQISTMYVAINGVSRLCYEIQYASDRDFESTLALLSRDGTLVSIQSYDPNLTDDFLQTSRLSGEPVSVVRPGRFEIDAVQEVVDTGAVALGNRRDIALPIHAAKRIHTVRKRGFFLQIAASAAGAALSILLLLFDRTGSVSSYAIPLYHVAWSTVALLWARFSLGNHELDR